MVLTSKQQKKYVREAASTHLTSKDFFTLYCIHDLESHEKKKCLRGILIPMLPYIVLINLLNGDHHS